jgi:hypothetical protein
MVAEVRVCFERIAASELSTGWRHGWRDVSVD